MCLKLTPLLGDGNLPSSFLTNGPGTKFKTNPAFRGRKPGSIVSYSILFSAFKTNPAFRGLKQNKFDALLTRIKV